MSLDFTLYEPKHLTCPNCQHPVPLLTCEGVYLFTANITHNLGRMASQAGLYECLWRPDQFNYKRAQDIILPLEKGINRLQAHPEWFKQFNALNGWGTYDQFLPWVSNVLEACKRYPESEISVSR